jgi:hypothetical protein
VAAGAAREAADSAAAAAVADHQPPAAPLVVAAAAVTAASVDVDSMSSAEKRALLEALGISMSDERGTRRDTNAQCDLRVLPVARWGSWWALRRNPGRPKGCSC